MDNLRILITLLFVSGLIAMGVGAAILFVPETFHANNGIELGDSIRLLNEVRASGWALLAIGALIMLVVQQGRFDGMPVQVAVLELVIGLFCVFVYANSRHVLHVVDDAKS